jgi:hypothetical protein
MIAMHVLKAHVKDGRIELDEPADLPEGTELHVTVVKNEDDISPELHAALDRSVEQMKAGQLIDGDDVHQRLRALRNR